MFLETVFGVVPFSSGVLSTVFSCNELHYVHLFFWDNSENNCSKNNLDFLGERTSEFLKDFDMLIATTLTSELNYSWQY